MSQKQVTAVKPRILAGQKKADRFPYHGYGVSCQQLKAFSFNWRARRSLSVYTVTLSKTHLNFRETISVHNLFREDLLERLAEEAAAEQLAVTVKMVDVTNKNDIDDLSTDIQTLDILFNCAG